MWERDTGKAIRESTRIKTKFNAKNVESCRSIFQNRRFCCRDVNLDLQATLRIED